MKQAYVFCKSCRFVTMCLGGMIDSPGYSDAENRPPVAFVFCDRCEKYALSNENGRDAIGYGMALPECNPRTFIKRCPECYAKHWSRRVEVKEWLKK